MPKPFATTPVGDTALADPLVFADDFTKTAVKKAVAALTAIVLLYEVFALFALGKRPSVLLAIADVTDPWELKSVLLSGCIVFPLGVLALLLALFLEHRTMTIDPSAKTVDLVTWRGWSSPRRIWKFTDFDGVQTIDHDNRHVLALKPRLGSHVIVPSSRSMPSETRDLNLRRIGSTLGRPILGHQGSTSGED